ncbi:hypothetical protein MBM_08264 [Drepanopeziza brunnea f. sp. 'multigermtubi' MB_m1]|uniref:Uncharacterized protein n=1 Tax=Marssonina brunnea f. sp. multigermtubi (strain MB_m1) TaxID=1072389 RepID=K1WL31_MARBU|nr:uncharacterized protein MBM_08264 [Drepanopeziza brunnea f. sp. 'multigermtubi' MB_m1]EKD13546.1 hypothetical protein MBM_08264 [Drepanopeziza brunnea f. sp. 'multigermtubi' MB_m1]
MADYKRVASAVIFITICLLVFLNLNFNYVPVQIVKHGEEQVEAPKLVNNPWKTSKQEVVHKDVQALQPTSPIDGISTAQPFGVPLNHGQTTRVPLVTYAYAETPYGRRNLEFFVKHGLHAAADFIFILNGDTDADETIIPKGLSNVKIIKRENTCFDLGAHWEVLTKVPGDGSGAKALKDTYHKFILMNASIRGPFVPHWSKECWTDAYLSKLSDKVKLVGSTINCMGGGSQHIQSMIYATDRIGLDIILLPEGIGECFPSLQSAMNAEIRTTPLVKSKGYHIDVMLANFQSEPDYAYENCTVNGEFLYDGAYYGFSVHPFETIFIKTNRGISPKLIDQHTEWVDASGYSSYDVCHVH